MYNPPTKDPRPQYSNCVAYSTTIWSDSFKDAYDEGFLAYKKGKTDEDNPYKPSGHERDTTFMDELHYYWWRGFSDGYDSE